MRIEHPVLPGKTRASSDTPKLCDRTLASVPDKENPVKIFLQPRQTIGEILFPTSCTAWIQILSGEKKKEMETEKMTQQIKAYALVDKTDGENKLISLHKTLGLAWAALDAEGREMLHGFGDERSQFTPDQVRRSLQDGYEVYLDVVELASKKVK